MGRYFRVQGLPNAVEEPAVNLTPLIDVVFVILIMFIVVAPLLELDRIELADAPADHSKSISIQESSPISVHVRQDNTIWVKNKPITFAELNQYLQASKKQFPKARPQLFHDSRARFGTYQAIKNAMEMAGFQQMDVILNPNS